MKRYFFIISLLAWFGLFVAGLSVYSGSWQIYTLFSLVFLAVLSAGIRSNRYGYLFFCVFLWLGFWLKLEHYIINNARYVEPTGLFDGSAKAWDETLWVGIAAAIGVLLAWATYSFVYRSPSVVPIHPNTTMPEWYPAARKRLWMGSLLVMATLATLNFIYGFYQVGPLPQTILPWPLNAVVFWLLSIGFLMWIVTLIHWDTLAGFTAMSGIYALMAEALFSTYSLLSRAVFLFHVLPAAIPALLNRKRLPATSNKSWIFAGLAFVLLFAFSVVGSSMLRNHYYYDVPIVETKESGGANNDAAHSDEAIHNTPSQLRSDISRLIVGRWIGLEGAMAVSSYPEKGMQLFKQGLLEKARVEDLKFYETIANSYYVEHTDLTRFRFGSAPGAPGLLYYSGSLWVVAVGMCFFALLLLISEHLILKWIANPFLCASFGWWAAFALVQFAPIPRIMAIHLFMHACGLVCIALIQAKVLGSRRGSE